MEVVSLVLNRWPTRSHIYKISSRNLQWTNEINSIQFGPMDRSKVPILKQWRWLTCNPQRDLLRRHLRSLESIVRLASDRAWNVHVSLYQRQAWPVLLVRIQWFSAHGAQVINTSRQQLIINTQSRNFTVFCCCHSDRNANVDNKRLTTWHHPNLCPWGVFSLQQVHYCLTSLRQKTSCKPPSTDLKLRLH